MEKEVIIEIISSCLQRLYTEQIELIHISASEVGINSRLAGYLRDYLEEDYMMVDMEYNRSGPKANTPKPYGDARDERRPNAIPDIIIHQRFVDHNNLLVAECKLRAISKRDLAKIEALLREYSYQYGLTVQYIPEIFRLYYLNEEGALVQQPIRL